MVTVVAQLICKDFSRHHLIRKVVTTGEVVTGSNADGAPARIRLTAQDMLNADVTSKAAIEIALTRPERCSLPRRHEFYAALQHFLVELLRCSIISVDSRRHTRRSRKEIRHGQAEHEIRR